MRSHPALSALATLVAFCTYCFGQAGKAELFGTIQDPQALAAAQAKVTVEEQATGARFDVVTDDRGEYHMLGLAAGQYVLTVEKPRLSPLPAGGHHAAHRRPDPARRKTGIGASLAVGGCERSGFVARNG